MSKRIIAAMSGGVDSSAAALLLLRQGFSVEGVTLRLHDKGEAAKAAADAGAVCAALGIKHYLFDMREEFYNGVIEPFAKGYLAGETPNPCVECNRTIKFSGLLRRAEALGCDMLATGHYVISEYDSASGRWLLRRAVDESKDQSYVLYVLTQDILAKTLFPLGGLKKQEIRQLAEQSGLPVAKRKESQDICFVPDGDYSAFLAGELGIASPEGSFVDTGGRVLGRHKGLIRYTTGQRRGLGVSAGKRIFVLGKDTEKNEVILGDEPLLFERRMRVRDLNWVSMNPAQSPFRAGVKARYRQSAQPAWVFPDEAGAVIEFDSPQRALTIGQAAVFYDGDVLLGGGTITQSGGAK